MKILQINHSYRHGGSTGRIVYDLSQICTQEKIESYVAYGYDFKPLREAHIYKICNIPQMQFSKLQTRIFGRHGFYNLRETRDLIEYIEEISPDIIHLHNIHNHYINAHLLFEYIKKKNIPVVWTLHDCWSFTGWCAYFDYAKCNKWIEGCYNCPSLRDYPYTWFFDRSKSNYEQKQKAFSGVYNLTIITPSQWLADLVKKSFLQNYPVRVINNGVDISVFKPTDSDIKEKLGIEGKKMILSVAAGFNKRKGFEYLLKLPQLLNDDEVLVLVGVKSEQIKLLPKGSCIGIERTNSIEELASYYSAADVFINTTLEDNFPTTNIEALACGTPVITFKTGGSVESVDEGTGVIVEQGNLDHLVEAKTWIFNKTKTFFSVKCRKKAELLYNKDVQFKKYIDLYRTII